MLQPLFRFHLEAEDVLAALAMNDNGDNDIKRGKGKRYLQRCFKHKSMAEARISDPATFDLQKRNGNIVLDKWR